MPKSQLAVLALAWGALACSSVRTEAIEAGIDAAPTNEVPVLTALAVSASVPTLGSVPIELTPAFSSSVFDYYVRCAAGRNRLTVSMAASSGAVTSLTQPSTSPLARQQTRTLEVNEGAAIVARATARTLTTEYWVRCLPHDFPEMSMIAHPEVGDPPPGYYLVGNRQTVNDTGGYAMVIDGKGVPVWFFREKRGAGVFNVDNVVGGAVSFVPSGVMPISYEVHELRPPRTTYPYLPGTAALDNHELRVLSNGHYLMLANPLKTGVDLSGLAVALPDAGSVALGSSSNIEDCDVVELDSHDHVYWTWVGSEHIDAREETTMPFVWKGETGPDGGPLVDVFHCNSIDVDPDGNLLVSARFMNSVFFVERATGKVLWKMGGKAYSKDGAIHVPVADPFFLQHDARFQTWSSCNGGSGAISMFDDQTLKPSPARGVVYDVSVGDGDGGTSGDCGSAQAPGATVAWQYRGLKHSVDSGSFRILPDGSRVIGWGTGGTSRLVFTEVNVKGDDLLDFYFTDGNSSYRAVKVPLTAFDLGVLRSTAGMD